MGQPLGFGAQLRPGGGLDLDLDERLERASDSGEIDVGMNSAYDPRIDQGVHTVVGGRLRHRNGLGQCAVGYSSPRHQNLQDQTVDRVQWSRILRRRCLGVIVFKCHHANLS